MGMISELTARINLFAMTGTMFLDNDPEITSGEAIDTAFGDVMAKLQELIDACWKWVIIGLAAVVVIWGAYIGIRIAIAHRNEEKINSRDMLKNLLIGILVIFIVAMGVPLLINALALWVG